MEVAAFLFCVGLGLLVLGALFRISKWRQGRRDGEVAAPWVLARRYFVDVHDVVSRDVYVARMHVLAAGGFVASLMLLAVAVVFGDGSRPLLAMGGIAAFLMGCGGVLAGIRRYTSVRPSRVSAGAYDLLPIALIGLSAFLCLTFWASWFEVQVEWWGAPEVLVLAGGIFGIMFLLPGMVIGPMRHAFAGAAHLIFHPRQERFEDQLAATGLRWVDLTADRIGAGSANDFRWQQLLSFDACVQCGRCEDVCPAHAAGAPLNPKKLIFDLWASSIGPKTDKGYRGNRDAGGEQVRQQTTDALIATDSILREETIWACTTCRACVEACPMLIEHVDSIVDIRRFQTLHLGQVPGKGTEALTNLRETDTVSGKRLEHRDRWATDLNIPQIAEGQEVEVLLWLGEASFDVRGQRTLRALIRILRAANVNFATLGKLEADVGDLARRLGDEATFQDLAARNVDALSRFSFDTIVTADPHVLQALGKEYSFLEAEFPVRHHTQFVHSLVQTGRLTVEALEPKSVTYHDPCYLGRYNGEYDAPRELLRLVGVDLQEMPRSRQKSFCCGWGGGAAYTDIASEIRVPDLRMQEVHETGASLVAVACPNCALMFDGVAEKNADVIDVIELVDMALPTGMGQ
ncbi:DUF3483 domain-containing protein [Pseudohaliea sp.]|uniref:DUF3483 domain-containing protein n=1 Tax=Pseudohaliea sp. TaxID=2740289 RepID=UPI0032EEA337